VEAEPSTSSSNNQSAESNDNTDEIDCKYDGNSQALVKYMYVQINGQHCDFQIMRI